jgi:hypothetical protein
MLPYSVTRCIILDTMIVEAKQWRQQAKPFLRKDVLESANGSHIRRNLSTMIFWSTITFGILLLLGFLNGLRRGPAKEALALIGVLLGATLVELWSPGWSQEIARRTDIDQTTAQWVLALLLLLGTALLSGYGSGLMLRHASLRTRDRIGGALVGLLNIGLLLGLALRYIQRWRFGERSPQQPVQSWIRQDPLSQFLLDWTGVVLLGLALTVAVVVVLTVSLRLIRRLRQPQPASPTPTTTSTPDIATQPTVPNLASLDQPTSAEESSESLPTIPIGQQEKFIDYPPRKRG